MRLVKQISSYVLILAALSFSQSVVILQNGKNGYKGCTDSYNIMNSTNGPTSLNLLEVEGYHCSACIDERSMIKFDLSSTDASSTILKATLSLYCTLQPRPGAGNIKVYKVVKPWNESQMTWYNASSSVKWATPGGDYGSSAITSRAYDIRTGIWHDFDITSSVKDFVQNPSTNYGVMLKLDPSMVTIDYVSSNSTDTTLRPKLAIIYSGTPVKNPLRNSLENKTSANQKSVNLFLSNRQALEGSHFLANGKALTIAKKNIPAGNMFFSPVR